LEVVQVVEINKVVAVVQVALKYFQLLLSVQIQLTQ
jgi:hypothetical protein